MPGLSFLNKKGFHTANLKNIERVWAAEKKAAEEQTKLAEYQKQINEERQIQELRQLQVASGQAVKTVDTTLDWMYEGPNAGMQAQQSSEEYLLGKIYKPQQEKNSEFGVLGMIDQRNANGSTTWMKKITSKNDSFTRVHEDPIVQIKKEEKKAMESVISNPLKMAKVKLKITQQLAVDDVDKKIRRDQKKEKKLRKKEKKDSKRRKRKEEHEMEKREVEENEKRNGKLPSRRSRSRSRSPSSSSSSSSDRASERGRSPDRRGGTQYGLQGKRKREESEQWRDRNREELGPSEQLLKKKQEREEQERAAKLALRRGGDRQELSAEERERRLKQMQLDAEYVDQSRIKRHGDFARRNGREDEDGDHRGRRNAAFLGEMRTEAYVQSQESGIQERLHQNRHYSQRGLDLQGDGFRRN